MRRTGALLLFLLSVTWAELAIGAENNEGIQWHEQVMDAWKKAQEDKRPLLVYVVMDGCAYCRKMERDTFSDPQIAKRVERSFIATKLNGPKDPTLAKRLKIEVYPTMVIISPDNKVLASIAGYMAADELFAQLESVAKDEEESVVAAAPAESDSSDTTTK